MLKEVLARFKALISGASDVVSSDLIMNLQKSLEYCIEENKVLREVLLDTYECKRVRLSEAQKKRLAAKAIVLERSILSDVIKIFQPETILGWHRDLVGRKYDSSKVESGAKRGPKTIPEEYIKQIVSLATRNPDWGYRRIASCMVYLEMKVSASTVRRILDDYGIVPEPEHAKRIEWKQFIDAHKHVIAATDFFTVEVLKPFGIIRYMVLFFIDISTRKVEIAGIQVDPYGKWMEQMARNMTDAFSGFLLDKKYLICDRDPLFTGKFKNILEDSGIEVKQIRSYTPVMNSFAEAFVKSIKTECINKLILTSEDQLQYVIKEYIEFYNHERPHQGLGGAMIEPRSQDKDGKVVEFNRLGGLLRSYRRIKAPEDIVQAA